MREHANSKFPDFRLRNRFFYISQEVFTFSYKQGSGYDKQIVATGWPIPILFRSPKGGGHLLSRNGRGERRSRP